MSGKTERLVDEVGNLDQTYHSPKRTDNQGSKLQVVVAGATAGLVARFFVAPLDVVKIRLQLQTHSLSDPLAQKLNVSGIPVYKGTLRTMRHIVRHEGVAGLWKGNVPAELLYVCYGAAQFTAYRGVTLGLAEVHAVLGGPSLAALDNFVAGAAAGAAATAATYPLDLLRTRFAAQGSGRDRVYASLRSAVGDIARDEGAAGFFRGLGPALIQIAPYMGAFFACYESLKPVAARLSGGDNNNNNNNNLGTSDAAAGVVAAVLAKTLVFPLDLVRKRIQVQGPTRARYVHKDRIPVYDGGVARALASITRTEGLRGLYRGLTVSLFKAAPANAITMWTYERVLHVMVGNKWFDG